MPETTRAMTEGHTCVNNNLRKKLTEQFKFQNALNLGSGGDYIEGWTNVDLDPNMKPDLVCNLDDQNLVIPIDNNTHDLVWCCNMMEHIWYLPQLKDEILRILQPGCPLIIVVPHYLSLDAWGDDTHVRAFSEHSWYINYWPGYHIQYQHIKLDATDSQGRKLQWMACILQKPLPGQKLQRPILKNNKKGA